MAVFLGVLAAPRLTGLAAVPPPTMSPPATLQPDSTYTPSPTSPSAQPTQKATLRPAPTPTAPSASQLIVSMQASDLAAATARLRFSSDFDEHGLTRVSTSAQGEVDFRRHALRISSRLQYRPSSGSVRRPMEDFVQLGRREATRIRPHSWRCAARSGFALPVGPGMLAAVVGGQMKSTYARPVETTLHGTPVWHVHQTIAATKAGTGSGAGSVDYFISRAHHTLLRTQVGLAASVRHLGTGKRQSQLTTVTDAAQQDLSSYGQAITITLPKACRG